MNGRIREGETIVLAGQEGPIVTTVRGILVPAPMSELRVKGSYDLIKEVVGAHGVKIIAKDLEKALAGLPIYVANDLADEVYYKVGSSCSSEPEFSGLENCFCVSKLCTVTEAAINLVGTGRPPMH